MSHDSLGGGLGIMTEADFGRLRYPDPRLLAHHAPLIELHESGLRYQDIAEELGRPYDGVLSSVRKLQKRGLLPLRGRG
jgi:hypothetical protein